MRHKALSIWERAGEWKEEILHQYRSVCSKRNGFVNVVLSAALATAMVLSLLEVAGSLIMLVKIPTIQGVTDAITWIFYPLFYIYHMAGFLGGNRKQAILPAFIGSAFVWYVVFFTYKVTTISFSDDEDAMLRTDLILIIVPFLLSVVLNIVVFGLIRAVMGIRKEGVTAWSQLTYSRNGKSKFQKAALAIACLLWLLPAIIDLIPYLI